MEHDKRLAAERRVLRLTVAEGHLREALMGASGMPKVEVAIKDALRIVARQAGKAMVALQIIDQEAVDGVDRGGSQADGVRESGV